MLDWGCACFGFTGDEFEHRMKKIAKVPIKEQKRFRVSSYVTGEDAIKDGIIPKVRMCQLTVASTNGKLEATDIQELMRAFYALRTANPEMQRGTTLAFFETYEKADRAVGSIEADTDLRYRYITAETNAFQLQQIIDDTRIGKVDMILCVRKMMEGVNIPECTCTLVTYPSKGSFTRARQASFRCTRGRNEDMVYIVYARTPKSCKYTVETILGIESFDGSGIVPESTPVSPGKRCRTRKVHANWKNGERGLIEVEVDNTSIPPPKRQRI
jgi:superfamily II DNA or RNA helicase